MSKFKIGDTVTIDPNYFDIYNGHDFASYVTVCDVRLNGFYVHYNNSRMWFYQDKAGTIVSHKDRVLKEVGVL